jgi:NADH-quinone oxidoreductase subunit N
MPETTDLLPILPILLVAATALTVLVVDWFVPAGEMRPQAGVALLGLLLAGLAILAGLAPPGIAFARTVTLADGGSVASGMVRVDGFGLYAQGIIVLAGLLSVLLGVTWMAQSGRRRAEYYVLLLVAAAAMMLLCVANDLILIFLAIETFSICLYVLSGFQRQDRAGQEAALKYFLLGAFSAGFLLYGTALLYAATGTVNLDAIAVQLAPRIASLPGIVYVGLGLLLVGLGFKVAMAPFHQWTPDVYEGAPLPVTAFMASATKVAAFAALFRVLWVAFPSLADVWQPVLAALALLSMLVGNLTALVQGDMKRMLAFSSIAQAGYLLVAVVSGPVLGAWALLFYLFQYAITTLGLFGVLLGLGRAAPSGRDATNLTDLAGLGRRNAGLAAALAILLFSLTGLPPTIGFLGKWYVFLAAVGAQYTWLAVAVVLNSVLAAFYYLRPVVLMYMAPGGEEQPLDVPTGAAVTAATTAVLASLALILALPLLRGAQSAPLAGATQETASSRQPIFISAPDRRQVP